MTAVIAAKRYQSAQPDLTHAHPYQCARLRCIQYWSQLLQITPRSGTAGYSQHVAESAIHDRQTRHTLFLLQNAAGCRGTHSIVKFSQQLPGLLLLGVLTLIQHLIKNAARAIGVTHINISTREIKFCTDLGHGGIFGMAPGLVLS